MASRGHYDKWLLAKGSLRQARSNWRASYAATQHYLDAANATNRGGVPGLQNQNEKSFETAY